MKKIITIIALLLLLAVIVLVLKKCKHKPVSSPKSYDMQTYDMNVLGSGNLYYINVYPRSGSGKSDTLRYDPTNRYYYIKEDGPNFLIGSSDWEDEGIIQFTSGIGKIELTKTGILYDKTNPTHAVNLSNENVWILIKLVRGATAELSTVEFWTTHISTAKPLSTGKNDTGKDR